MIDRHCRDASPHSAKFAFGTALAAALLLPLAASAAPAGRHFQADLMPLNAKVGGGASGQVTLILNKNDLVINAHVTGLSPGMHMIHIHGFKTGDQAASCVSAAQDTDHDGILDLAETESVSGTTLIPFNAHPAALNITGAGYPKANKAGEFTYRKTVSVKRLDANLKKQDGIDSLHLDRRVIYVHGVPASKNLPSSVKSLPGVPATMTLPVACGVIRAAR